MKAKSHRNCGGRTRVKCLSENHDGIAFPSSPERQVPSSMRHSHSNVSAALTEASPARPIRLLPLLLYLCFAACCIHFDSASGMDIQPATEAEARLIEAIAQNEAAELPAHRLPNGKDDVQDTSALPPSLSTIRGPFLRAILLQKSPASEPLNPLSLIGGIVEGRVDLSGSAISRAVYFNGTKFTDGLIANETRWLTGIDLVDIECPRIEFVQASFAAGLTVSGARIGTLRLAGSVTTGSLNLREIDFLDSTSHLDMWRVQCGSLSLTDLAIHHIDLSESRISGSLLCSNIEAKDEGQAGQEWQSLVLNLEEAQIDREAAMDRLGNAEVPASLEGKGLRVEGSFRIETSFVDQIDLDLKQAR